MPEGMFKGEGAGVYTASGNLSKQERVFLNEEMEKNRRAGTQGQIEALRAKEGPKIIVEKYRDLLHQLLDEYGDAKDLTINQCEEFSQENDLCNFEGIVILAAALEADEQRKVTRQ